MNGAQPHETRSADPGRRPEPEPEPVEGVSGLAKKAFLDGVDIVTFTSSSTVRNLVEMLNGDLTALQASFIGCIGPVTTATARELGLRVDLEASEHTVEGLVDALINHFSTG